MNLLDTNAVDIDRVQFADFDYNETEGGVDDHGGEDEVEEVDEEAYEEAQTKNREIEELHDLGRSNLDQGLECGVSMRARVHLKPPRDIGKESKINTSA